MRVYSKLHAECLFLVSLFPQYFVYKYGYMTDVADDYEGRGAPFYKFGIKTVGENCEFFVGFHEGGLGEGVGFMDSFWSTVGEWFVCASDRVKSLSKIYGEKHAELFWLLSLQEVMRYRLDNFVPKTVVEVEQLAISNLNDDVKFYLLGSSMTSDEFVKLEGLALDYAVSYAGSSIRLSDINKTWMHVLKSEGLS